MDERGLDGDVGMIGWGMGVYGCDDEEGGGFFVVDYWFGIITDLRGGHVGSVTTGSGWMDRGGYVVVGGLGAVGWVTGWGAVVADLAWG